MSEPTEAEIRARHEPSEHPGWWPEYGTDHYCLLDGQRWPCDTARVLALLDAERASQARLDGLAEGPDLVFSTYATSSLACDDRWWQPKPLTADDTP